MSKRRVVKVPLTEEGVANAIRELEDYRTWMQERTRAFLKALAAEGVEIASCKFHWAVYDGTNDVTVEMEDRGKNRVAVVAVGSAVLFIEFGTGTKTWPDNHPEAHELGMIRGEYGDRRGQHKAWVYRGEAGTNGVPVIKGKKDKDLNRIKTYGNPANMSMYQTVNELRERFEELAKEAFK
jgi:hypothetical protein